MPEVFNILMVGVGGQGVVLVSDIAAEAAMRAGYDVKKSEIHGMSQRGGPVFGHVRFGRRVHSPTVPEGEADVLFALERMELLRWARWARPGGHVVYVANDTLPQAVTAYPAGLEAEIERLFPQAVRVEPARLRGEVSPKVVNTVLLGAMSMVTPIAPEFFLAALPGHCPPGTAEVNEKAFELGRQLGREAYPSRADLTV